jgi:ABC-2 type transport system ATP-binding protein
VTQWSCTADVPGDVEVWPHLTGGEVIDMFLRLRGDYSARRRNALVDRFELDPRKKARTYSKGNRQKVALIAALAADVDLLLLDEPTAGLDPLMEAVFQEVIRERTAEGTSVLLSSHILSQVEALSDRVSIIRAGRIVESGSLTDLRHMSRTTIEVDTAQPAHDLAALDGVHHVRSEAGRTVFDVDGDRVSHVVSALAPLGVRSLTAHPPTLEQLLMRHYGDSPASRH